MEHYGQRVGQQASANDYNHTHNHPHNHSHNHNHTHNHFDPSDGQHVHNDAVVMSSTQHYHHSHVASGIGVTQPSGNASHSQASSSLPGGDTISYVPYYHSNSQYQDDNQYPVMQPQHNHPQFQANAKHQHSTPDAIHSLSLGTPIGLGAIQAEYYQRRANSIEVPPNVSLSGNSQQDFGRSIGDGTPTGTQSSVNSMHALMHQQYQTPNPNQIQPTGRQLLQGPDGVSVPVDTSGMIKIKRWKIFPGRNRFFCDGRFVMAKEPAVFAFTIILLCGTFASFVHFDCQYLGRRVSWAIPICGILLFIFVVSTLLRTTFTDPGIIPRATPEEAMAFEQFSSGNPSPSYRPPPRTKEVIIRNQPVKLKYCFTCKILRPPRASHCSLCDNCVERFDHHCPWVGNCVGRRNYRFFYMFIVSLAFLTVYVFACVVTHLTLLSNESSITDAIKASPASMIVSIICFFSMWSIIGLAGFHTYLILNNLTTNEDIKGSFSSKRANSIKNPYTGSACENCVEILCSPLTPSLLKSRTYIYCDEQKFMARRRRKSNSSSAADSPIPPPPIRQSPYPLATPFPGPSTSIGNYQMEHDHQNSQYILQHHQNRQQQQQQQINRNSHSMQNMAGSFTGATPPLSMRAHMQQQHRTLPTENPSQVRYDCSSLDGNGNTSGNVFINQNLNLLPNECVSGLGSVVPNQMGASYQHKNCATVGGQNKHFSN